MLREVETILLLIFFFGGGGGVCTAEHWSNKLLFHSRWKLFSFQGINSFQVLIF